MMDIAEKITTNIPSIGIPSLQLIITVVLCGTIAYALIWLTKALGGAAVDILGKIKWLIGAAILGFGIWIYLTTK